MWISTINWDLTSTYENCALKQQGSKILLGDLKSARAKQKKKLKSTALISKSLIIGHKFCIYTHAFQQENNFLLSMELKKLRTLVLESLKT